MSNNLSERHYGGTFCMSKAGLAEGTNAATIKTAAPNGAGTDYCIDGVLYHKADTDNIAMTALAEQADNTTCLYLVQINASGTVSLVKGDEVATEDLANDEVIAQWPEPSADNCPLGGFRIVTSGSTFTSGTTDLGAANITDTFYDFFAVPPAGLLA
ncbi:hypothetical protein ACFQH5_20220 [Halomonas salifodinae]|uniref:Uncharacterized protein n=1 Tax=Halomonas salifodinae TaxID=438745 RepID=A0ABW2F4J9_9GAMM